MIIEEARKEVACMDEAERQRLMQKADEIPRRSTGYLDDKDLPPIYYMHLLSVPDELARLVGALIGRAHQFMGVKAEVSVKWFEAVSPDVAGYFAELGLPPFRPVTLINGKAILLEDGRGRIRLNRRFESIDQLVSVIGHEMRHIRQLELGWSFDTKEELRRAEADAHVQAMLFVSDYWQTAKESFDLSHPDVQPSENRMEMEFREAVSGEAASYDWMESEIRSHMEGYTTFQKQAIHMLTKPPTTNPRSP